MASWFGSGYSLSSQEALELFSANEVFACENSTLYLYQDPDFILMLGHTVRYPLKLESRSSSMLLVSWKEKMQPPADPVPVYSVSLYHSEMKAYAALSVDRTHSNHYRFTALESCSSYAACVELAGSHSLTCLSTITDPEVPRHFQVTSWNSSSVTVSWDCPDNRKFSFFLVTVLHLNGTNHVLEERSFRHTLDTFVFSQSDLPPCSRVKFGLQTVCEAGTEARHSRMVLINGNTVHSEIKKLWQTSSGPDNYTLSWVVRNTSSISMFRIYHQGALHNTTLLTSHTVASLLPCNQYQARVEALCGDSVVMSAKTVRARTGKLQSPELEAHVERLRDRCLGSSHVYF
ncbi:uncharacterized protein LOC121548167 [Coregonus clupeaformis]|uniref:uncharacterized protein LOC121548167 n=1 Tax=Coregonus clupeaformis TaxID=59861 RepID=UPI001BE0E65F|nr:uncharacterized protein LOC121548167 [Coregonus clupeaformis]